MEEIWKALTGREGLYEISNFGRIKSLDRFVNVKGGKRFKKQYILKGYKTPAGYICHTLNLNKPELVHRLVAEHFIDNPQKYNVVNHLNSIKTDNKYTNLEWCTPKQNVHHCVNEGRFADFSGENNGRCTISEETARLIKQEIAKNTRSIDICKILNVKPHIVCDIKAGRSWGCV